MSDMRNLDTVPALPISEALEEVHWLLVRAKRHLALTSSDNETEYRCKHMLIHAIEGAMGVAGNARPLVASAQAPGAAQPAAQENSE